MMTVDCPHYLKQLISFLLLPGIKNFSCGWEIIIVDNCRREMARSTGSEQKNILNIMEGPADNGKDGK